MNLSSIIKHPPWHSAVGCLDKKVQVHGTSAIILCPVVPTPQRVYENNDKARARLIFDFILKWKDSF